MKQSDPIAAQTGEAPNLSNGNFAALPDEMPPVPDVSQSTKHYYRIGLIGSKASGKTCLLAALNMQMTVHPRGYHAVMPALHGDESKFLKDGHQWIEAACNSLKKGEWPEPNYNNHEARRLSVRFQFSDGATRKKLVELFDYSGELLDPGTSQSELAANLRDLLQEMDALIMLAETPMHGQDSSELNDTLNGLLGVFALLVEQRKEPTRQIPIALCVNKWDRTGHLNANNIPETQSQLLDSFLASAPPPFHQNILNALRPAAGAGRLKAFPVSACSAIAVGPEGEVKELPPNYGQLRSFGVQDPFLWLIEQRDDMDLVKARERIDELSKKRLAPPWRPWRELRTLKSKRNRFEKATPEGRRLVSLVKDARWLIVRQIFTYVFLLLVIEAFSDGWGHRNALSNITLPTRDVGWQQGTVWLRDYGQSLPVRHSLYNLILKKHTALDLAYQVERQKDDDLLASSVKALEEHNLEEAKRLAEEHKAHFSNSSNKVKIQRVLASVDEIERSLAFEKLLNRWGHELVALRPTTDDAERDTQNKLDKLSALLSEVRDAQSVPLAGKLRTDWTALLSNIDSTRVKLAERLNAIGLVGKIRQAIDAADYPHAADLLASPEFQKAPDNEVLRSFQFSLGKWVQERCKRLSNQGENWRGAVDYAEKFLEPAWRTVVPENVQSAIRSTIQDTKQKGDRYFYELAQANKSDDALDRYLSAEAPIHSMEEEATKYRKWLHDREIPHKLIFRLVSIQWEANVAKGYWGRTAIKLIVNGSEDGRNSQEDDNRRTGTTAFDSGIRVVTLDNLAQTKAIGVAFQCYHASNGWKLVSSNEVSKTPEDLTKEPIYDSAGNRIEIHVDGVISEPLLPTWQPPK